MTTQKDFIEAKKDQKLAQAGISDEVSSKQAERERFQRHTDEFLAAGGKITVIEAGVSAETQQLTEKQNRLNGRNAMYFKKGKDSIGREKGGAHDHCERTWQARKDKGLV